MIFLPTAKSEGAKKSHTSIRQKHIIQPKLTVNQPGDRYEQEADRVADAVMRMKDGDAPVLQRMPLTPVLAVQRQSSSGEGAGAAPPIVSEVLSSGGGQPLDAGTQQFMESRFGRDFSEVRVHADGRAVESAAAIQARAYTNGQEVVVGKGEFHPETEAGRRLLAHELTHVVQQGGGNLHLNKMRDKSPSISGESVIIQRYLAGESGSTGRETDSFSEAFNREFAGQLHIFGTDSLSMAEQGPDVNSTQLDRASGEPVSPSELNRLFTPAQREKLSRFFETRLIPDRLFNGDEVGNTSPQQRIILSGHILTVGQYQPGSDSQRVYARMCGHWANLVYHYAGVGDAGGRGVREQFDHEGHFSLGTGSRDDSWSGPVIQDSEYAPGDERPTHSRFQMRGLLWDQLMALRSGDWIWYFNDNGGGGGNHSVIFSRWASEVQVAHDSAGRENRCRRAICFSQGNPADGGHEHTTLLGERYMADFGGHRVCPVTHYSRVSEDAHPIRNADDLARVLGSGGEATRNSRFISALASRHRGMRFNWEALAEELRTRNTAALDALTTAHRGRMTNGQINAIRALNQRPIGESHDMNITLLVSLNTRLHHWLSNATTLQTGERTQTGRVRTLRETNWEATAEDRERLSALIEGYDQQIETDEQARDAIEAQITDLDVHGELREAMRIRGRLRQERSALRAERRSAADETRRTEIDTRLTALITELREADSQVEDFTEQQMQNHTQLRTARQARGPLTRSINIATRRRAQAEEALSAIMARSGRFMVHPGGPIAFNGREEERQGGLLENLRPRPNWNEFFVQSD